MAAAESHRHSLLPGFSGHWNYATSWACLLLYIVTTRCCTAGQAASLCLSTYAEPKPRMALLARGRAGNLPPFLPCSSLPFPSGAARAGTSSPAPMGSFGEAGQGKQGTPEAPCWAEGDMEATRLGSCSASAREGGLLLQEASYRT